uniref:WW domain binding protein VOPP1 n=1 Tax=Rhodnius prolixus TaxID=13249 RepID=T1I5G0_RHOPR
MGFRFQMCVVALAVLCGCGCGLWKKKSRPVRQQSEPPTPDSCYHPPNYSRCSSFHQPPPYAEVTSKPDLYPLVISYTENGKTGGSYLMVQYFRNYIMRPVGSLSATSTADSLSSSLFCSATNEANSLIPPPYSSAPGSVEQINSQTSPPTEGVGSGGGGSNSTRNKYRGRGWLSRSAPTTPSSRLTPATAFPTGESSPLLAADQDTMF